MKKISLPLTAILLFSTFAISQAEESLKDQLDTRRAQFLEKAPAEVADLYQDGIDNVAATGILESAKQTGDTAPDFTLADPTGKDVTLSEQLASGPVVLTWYRGEWCPYCNITLAALRDAQPEIEKQGATLLGLTPESPDYVVTAKDKLFIPFTVLTDPGNQVAKQYGVVFTVDPEIAQMMQDKFQMRDRNRDDSDQLPLAATYVIAPDGEILYAFLDADYRNRAEPAEIISVLEKYNEKN